MKKVIFWEPKRDEKRNAKGEPIQGDFVGKFRSKVPEGTPGALRYVGENAAGVKWDYWGLNVDSISGKLRWIDKQDNGDYGTNLILFLETDRFLHRLSIKYDPFELRNVMNHLCGLGKHVGTSVVNLSYWVRKSMDKNKNVKTDKDGKPIWSKSISFRDIAPEFSYDEWIDFSQTHGLDWEQITRPNGKKEWICDAEYKYWDSRLLALQKFLLKTETVLPFCYNSMTACEAPNPSGGGNLSSEEVELCKEIYERVKSDYQFPFNRVETNADDAFDQPEPKQAQEARIKALSTPSNTAQPTRGGFADPVSIPLPTQDTTNFEVGAFADDESLPF